MIIAVILIQILNTNTEYVEGSDGVSGPDGHMRSFYCVRQKCNRRRRQDSTNNSHLITDWVILKLI